MNSLFETTENTRDIGGYRTKYGSRISYNSLLRSDIPEHPNEKDIAYLNVHNITTVIDLRSVDEVHRRPCGFAGVPGICYVNCPIPEGSAIPETVDAVPESYLVIAGSEGMKQAVHEIAKAKAGVLYHCTAGKDRTGVLTAILMLEAGVEDAEIIENYVLTRDCLQEQFRSMHQRFPEIDMNIVTPKEWYMEQFLKLFRERYGCAEEYFKKIGLCEEEVEGIRGKLM